MEVLKEHIDKERIPSHIAVIMDGNGRWAKSKGKARIFGHKSAIKAVTDTVEGCAEMGVKYLTLYAFSTENWNRPKLEVSALMELLISSLRKELPTLMKNNIRLKSIGDTSRLPSRCQKQLRESESRTKDNTHMTLVLALSYSAKWELVSAVKKIAEKATNGDIAIDDICDETISNHLTTSEIPDPDLMIRTSGEHRISNFLLWQMAYTELCFIDKMWPDFRKPDLWQAILNYQNRERRFGKTTDQITK
jgi:undecaprenyl diphosphate synthase